jgi:hypothetical protein
MTNHVHVIAIPQAADSLAKGIGRTHVRYSQYINRFHKRSGHLWQGRFYSWRVDEIDETTGAIAPGVAWTFATQMNSIAPISDGLVLHFDATVLDGLPSGTKPTLWPGRVGGVNGTAGSRTQGGTFVPDVLNGQPVVRFSGSGEYYDFPEITTIRTVLWVLKEDADAAADKEQGDVVPRRRRRRRYRWRDTGELGGRGWNGYNGSHHVERGISGDHRRRCGQRAGAGPSICCKGLQRRYG